MKNYTNTLILGTLLVAGVSCNDWLDLESQNRVVVEKGKGITSLAEADAKINALYDKFRAYECYGARMTYYGDACSEDMQAVGNTKRVASYYTFRWTADNAPSTFWTRFYDIIGNANILLEGIDGLAVTTAADSAARNDYKGQALTARALAYFDLTRLYGYPYTKDAGASWGVPIVDKQVAVDYKPRRNTVAECYDFIIKDLIGADTLLKDAKNNGKFNKWAAKALLSRVYLYKGDNDNALQTAKDAISGAEGKDYALWTATEYKGAWAAEFGSESLWEIQSTATEAIGHEGMGYLVSGSGYDDIVVSDDWKVTLMGNQTDDTRYKCLINNTSSGSRSGLRYMWKYPPNTGESSSSGRDYANIKVLRLSEVYLIAAEAAARSGNNEDAVKYLDPIAKRGLAANSVAGTTVTLNRVLEERRKELVGEGHRFFDAIRNHKRITRTQGLAYPHLPTILPDAWDFDWDYYKVVLPIPKAEMDANENIRAQQNPGY